MKGYVFQNINFCVIKIYYEIESTSLFDYSFGYFITSIPLNVKSLQNPFAQETLH